MASFEEFKSFIKDKPYLKDKVKKGKTSWQDLFERYDLYGEDDEIFKKEEKEIKEETNKQDEEVEPENKEDMFSSFFNMLSGIDVDKISEGLNGMKKILNILQEVTATDDVTSFTRRSQKPYKRDAD